MGVRTRIQRGPAHAFSHTREERLRLRAGIVNGQWAVCAEGDAAPDAVQARRVERDDERCRAAWFHPNAESTRFTIPEKIHRSTCLA